MIPHNPMPRCYCDALAGKDWRCYWCRLDAAHYYAQMRLQTAAMLRVRDGQITFSAPAVSAASGAAMDAGLRRINVRRYFERMEGK